MENKKTLIEALTEGEIIVKGVIEKYVIVKKGMKLYDNGHCIQVNYRSNWYVITAEYYERIQQNFNLLITEDQIAKGKFDKPHFNILVKERVATDSKTWEGMAG